MGYGQTAVEDIIACAGVSRRTFYDLFKNKEEAFLAAYDDGVERLFEAVTAAYAQEGPWPDRARNGLAAFLCGLAQFPDLAHMCIVDVLAAGPTALTRRDAAMQRFVDMIEEGRRELPDVANIPAIAVPMGYTTGGLPLSLQIGAKPFDESGVFQVAHSFEQATAWHARHPDLERSREIARGWAA